jgi:hypothetical protein
MGATASARRKSIKKEVGKYMYIEVHTNVKYCQSSDTISNKTCKDASNEKVINVIASGTDHIITEHTDTVPKGRVACVGKLA